MSLQREPLVLASKSEARAKMLRHAGLDIRLHDSAIDERSLELALTGQDADAGAIAEHLASAKAEATSRIFGSILTIGADQTLECNGKRYSKVTTRNEAGRKLLELGGNTHHLHSAVALASNGTVIWSTVITAHMTMRPLSSAMIEHYLDEAGDAILGSVGCYHYEGLGIQLFEQVEGDFHTILGMPLLPLLHQLRLLGIIAT